MSVAGHAGTVRIKRLDAKGLELAVRHARREDEISLDRVTRPGNPPVTTTGLDYESLYAAHVQGAKRNKTAEALALHVGLQFPKNLVDGEDPEFMLRHARAFITSVFGEDAIFADRIDRDEESRHFVDIFVAPKYEKTTKARGKKPETTTTWVSLTKHLKDLCKEFGEYNKNGDPDLRCQGRALQSAFYAYMHHQMKLQGVQRGQQKLWRGDDWKTPEYIKAQHLARELAERTKYAVPELLKQAMVGNFIALPDQGEFAVDTDILAKFGELTQATSYDTAYEIGRAVQDVKTEIERARQAKLAAAEPTPAEIERVRQTKLAAAEPTPAEIERVRQTKLAAAEPTPAEIERVRQTKLAAAEPTPAEIERVRQTKLAEIEPEIAKLTAEAERNQQATALALRQAQEAAARAANEEQRAKNVAAMWREKSRTGEAKLAAREAELNAKSQKLDQDRAAIDQRDREIRAFEAGLTAYADGKIVGAGEEDGPKVLIWSAAALKDGSAAKLALAIKPAMDRVWTWVRQKGQEMLRFRATMVGKLNALPAAQRSTPEAREAEQIAQPDKTELEYQQAMALMRARAAGKGL